MSPAAYEATARHALAAWRSKMLKRPGPWDSATKTLQNRVNALIPERVHAAITAAEGGVAGAGGFLLGAAEFPILLSTKIKLLFDIAALYGHEGSLFRERLYILGIFELAFASAPRRKDAFAALADWRDDDPDARTSFESFDWRTFQQEYRDYIDLAKLAQLVPVIGAPVGVVVNWRLLEKLGETAMNAYRMRWFADQEPNREGPVIQP